MNLKISQEQTEGLGLPNFTESKGGNLTQNPIQTYEKKVKKPEKNVAIGFILDRGHSITLKEYRDAGGSIIYKPLSCRFNEEDIPNLPNMLSVKAVEKFFSQTSLYFKPYPEAVFTFEDAVSIINCRVYLSTDSTSLIVKHVIPLKTAKKYHKNDEKKALSYLNGELWPLFVEALKYTFNKERKSKN